MRLIGQRTGVWQRGASRLALAAAIAHAPLADAPLQAQTTAILRASQGLSSPVVTAPAVLAPRPAVAPNAAGMVSASARAIANQAAVTSATSLAVQANTAARASARALVQTVPNGLVAGGLVPVANPTTAALDATGLRTWQGALQPVQSGPAATPTVTVTQTQSRALLSWESFNVGQDTTLQFAQGAPDWVVLNRIVGNIDPTTGRLANPGALSPSQILGTIKADGTVIVINQNGIMFGATGQLNARAAILSSLEIGDRIKSVVGVVGSVPTSLQDRGITFLQSGLLAQQQLLSATTVRQVGGVVDPVQPEGAVSVAAGGQITSAAGGFVIIAGPVVSNAGELRSPEGQVSLQSGRSIVATSSSGASDSADPGIRGLILTSTGITPDSVTNAATGTIDAPRGYVSLGATATGTVDVAGVLTATTSVARNGRISLIGGAAVTIAPRTVIAITPDAQLNLDGDAETIPQSAESVAAFKRSEIIVGGIAEPGSVEPTRIIVGANALIYAPGAEVNIGARNDSDIAILTGSNLPSSVLVDTGATIDVGGIKDFVVPASRNSIEIFPTRRNELRDTPNYREGLTQAEIDAGSERFTLNGARLFVDPRLSGVRADGVAWVGSPLIEAGSYFAQIGVTAAELLTTGGDLTLGARSFSQGLSVPVPGVTVRAGAVLDVSGGWTRYEAGVVKTSRLLTADGRIVEIGAADPNDNFVGVADAIDISQPRFGISQNFGNPAVEGIDLETGYTEGRDAGSLTIKASTNTLAGTIYGDAFAGTQQLARGRQASAAPVIASDLRRLQAAPAELPSGGLLKIQATGTGTTRSIGISPAGALLPGGAALPGGADIIVHAGSEATPGRPQSEIVVSDAYLSGAGLAQVTLQTSGKVTFTAGSALTLAPGGALVVDAGRTIRFDGSVNVPSGTIAARTYEIAIGSVFTPADDILPFLATGLATPRMLDIVVNGSLSARGRWTNDALVTDGAYLGGGFADGGSVSLTAAPRVLVPIGSFTTAEFAADLSGSILVNATARIDVSGGGHVRPDATLELTGRGGDVALINETVYSSLGQSVIPGVAQARITGIEAPNFVTTPAFGRQTGLTPRVFEAQVVVAPGTIAAQGFAGGGAFTLVTPDLNFGARAGATGTALPLDFFSSSGFGAFSLTTYTSQLFAPVVINGVEVNAIFANGLNGASAVLTTEVAEVRAGETLNLTQAVIPSLLDDGQIAAVTALATGGDIRALLGSFVPVDAFDRLPVALDLGGLSELQVAAGGTIAGSDGAALTMTRLSNAGTIRLPGGIVRQSAVLAATLVNARDSNLSNREANGVASLDAAFGARDANRLFSETGENQLGIRFDSNLGGRLLTNAELTTLGGPSRLLYLTATLGEDEGVRLLAGSVTDLSGASIRNPRAGSRPGGEQKIEGRIVDAGTLETASNFLDQTPLFTLPMLGAQRYGIAGQQVPVRRAGLTLTAETGATVRLTGASDRYDEQVALGVFELAPVWSNGGRLTLGAGGSIAGALVDARGGAAAAEGGVLTWAAPVLTQSDTAGQAGNVVAADQIMASGFDSFVAYDRLTSLGDVNLSLRRGFTLTALPYDGQSALASFGARLATGGELRIDAPQIRLESPQQRVQGLDATVEIAGSVILSGQTIDIVGGVSVENSVGRLTLDASGDVRLIGVQAPQQTLTRSSSTEVNALGGQLLVGGDLVIRAAQAYPTTGTGSLQREINARRAGTAAASGSTGAPAAAPPAEAFLIASTGPDATIAFARATGPIPAAPYSAGGNLLVQAANIEQNGVLRVPLGRLTLGSNTPLALRIGTQVIGTVPATASVTLGAGSVTSVSAGGLSIPYGTTTDLIEYFFAPTSDGRLTAPPTAELRLAGDRLAIEGADTGGLTLGAVVDASGGGELYAYEFVPGVGGSRDVLSRFNSDPFSSANGLQFPDGRQVYAIVPSLSAAGVALFDPIYSADYAALQGLDTGRRVFLEGAPGLAAGWYTLLPAQYALLPGGLRVVENVGQEAAAIGDNAVLRDGSIITAGRFGVTGTGIEESRRRSFTVQDQATFRKFSNLQLTLATPTFNNLATRDGLAVPRLPIDAGRLVLTPISELAINTAFVTTPVTAGRGAQVDIAGAAFTITAPGAADAATGISLTTAEINNLGAASLLIGGVRTDNADGTTALVSNTRSILVANNAANPLRASEVVLVVDGIGSTIRIEDGAVIEASGTLNDSRTGNYTTTVNALTGVTGTNSIVRVANGPERLIVRPGETEFVSSLDETSVSIGDARLAGETILLDSSRDVVITDNLLNPGRPVIAASASLVLGGDDVHFTTVPSGYRGLTVTPDLQSQFAAAERLTIISRSIISFAEGDYRFNDLTLDVRGIRPYGQATFILPPPRQDQFDVVVPDLTAPIAVGITARELAWRNDDFSRGVCGDVPTVTACGASGNTLAINAASVRLGAGDRNFYGFDGGVSITAAQGVFVEGAGALDFGVGDARIAAPFFGDRALVADPRGVKVQPALALFTNGGVSLTGPGAGLAPAAVAAAPGATLAFGSIDRPVESFSAAGLELRASAGIVDVRSQGSISASGATVLATPGYAKTFGDAAELQSPFQTVSAPGGMINLVSLGGDIALAPSVRVSVGGGSGTAGALQLSAGLGAVSLPGTIDASAPRGKASFRLDSGTSSFDLPGFLGGIGSAFTGDFRIRTGTGNLVVGPAQTLRAETVRLTADGGLIDIAGTIDTSGIGGGDIGLFGTAGVTLRETARLDAHADGYPDTDTRAASGGTVEIGTAGTGVISVAAGAVIDVAARRPGARLVAQIRKDPLTLNDRITYNYAQGDIGGTLSLRAPVVATAAGDSVNINFSGSVLGASDIEVEGYRSYDLRALAGLADCSVAADLCINSDFQAVLDINAVPGSNRLASRVAGGIPDFIRNFNLSAATGLGTLRSDPAFHARPGVSLEFRGDIVLASNWNLAAGVLDEAAATAAGLLAPSLQLPGQVFVVPGREAELFSGSFRDAGVDKPFVDFTYRVGGRAAGEAGVLTLRAGGDLDIRGSITDGFFSFGDQTDPQYVSFQLGGGQRGYRPAFSLTCGASGTSCDALSESLFFVYPGFVTSPIPAAESITFPVNNLLLGQDIADLFGDPVAPYRAAANAPGALGGFAGGGGDPIGGASIFPALADGTAAESFSLRLVAGATPAGIAPLPVTADPLAVAASSAGSVSVSGETSYRAAAASVPQRFVGDLQVAVNIGRPAVGAPVTAFPGDLIGALEQSGVVLEPQTYTRVIFTGANAGIRNFFIAEARAFFAANSIPADQYQFFGAPANPGSLATSAELMLRFLAAIGPEFTRRINSTGPDRLVYPAPVPRTPTFLENPNITTRSLVRTGTGSIDVAAAGDVDLTNGRPIFRNVDNRTVINDQSAQVGGTAIYTAGYGVNPGETLAALSTTSTLSLDPAFLAAPVTLGRYTPNLRGVLDNEPFYANGGGDIRISSGRDVLARRDAWSEQFRADALAGTKLTLNAGTDTQLWRVAVGGNSAVPFNIRLNPQLFSTGVGALGGGDVTVSAGRNIRELTAVSATSITTANVTDPATNVTTSQAALLSYGGGDVSLAAGASILGGQVDVASGRGGIVSGNAIASAGELRLSATEEISREPSAFIPLESNLLRLRVADATIAVSALGATTLAAITSTDGEGFYSAAAGVSVRGNGDFRLTNAGKDVRARFSLNNDGVPNAVGVVLPGTLEIASLFGNIDLRDGAENIPTPVVLVPSPIGQLRLFAGGNLAPVTLAMEDGDPSLLPGPLSARGGGILAGSGTRLFGFPVILPNTSETQRRLLHNERLTHAGDREPVRLFADGDINQVSLWLPKAARIGAGGDIVDMVFIGQNTDAADVTRITAGRDIVASALVVPVPLERNGATVNLPVLQGNSFVLGGPGALFLEAGRDLGPFFNSAITETQIATNRFVNLSYAGGVQTVGNDYNPWLGPQGARIYTQFGIAGGIDDGALRSTYVDPANVGALDGDLFVQSIDLLGNRTPDRAKPIYPSALVSWLVENQPEALATAFGRPIAISGDQVLPLLASLDPAVRTQFLADLTYLPDGGGISSPTVAIDRSIASAPVLKTEAAAVADAPGGQRTTISGSTLIGWLAQNAPSVLVARYGISPSLTGRQLTDAAYAQLLLLPALVQRQFLLDRVYFNELAATSRPNGASFLQYQRSYRAVNLLFPPRLGYTANDISGASNGGTRVATGNLDLRLAAIESQRGGDINILGPGGRVLGGSVVATSAQARRRGLEVVDVFNDSGVYQDGGTNLFRGRRRGSSVFPAARILGIPIGFEGILTLRGGNIRGFTDGDVLLNQSRLFTIGGGDVTLFSANGDLNAGQGARTSANNPPAVVRFDPDGFGELDQAGAIAGAGISALTPVGGDRAPDVTLVAPVGTVDAGDAGVRASGNIFVAAASIGNASGFQSESGTVSGTGIAAGPDLGAAASANAASAAASQAAAAVNPGGRRTAEERSRILVEVLGFAGNASDDPCNLPRDQRPPNCPVPGN